MNGYLTVAVLLGLGIVVVAAAMQVNRLLRPRRGPGEGNQGYECGVDPVGGGWAQSQVRYYVYAFLYVVFAVETVFVYPWATVFADPGFGPTAAVEMGVFVGFLALVIVYAWRKRVLEWVE